MVGKGKDIFGIDSATKQKYGIQCKQKGYSKNLTEYELNTEIGNAKVFLPKLDVFIVATTAPKDQAIETYARTISDGNAVNGEFKVCVYGWGDIQAILNDHPSILMKYYQRLLEPTNPNDHYFKFWYEEARIDKFFYYTCYLPFWLFDIRYSEIFINLLMGYLNKHDVFLANTTANSSDDPLKESIRLFNDAARTLINLIKEYPPKAAQLDSDDDILNIYWVDCDHLSYGEQGEFIDSKKDQVRKGFHRLIQAANNIISVWNTQLNSIQQIALVEFSWPNPNFPLFGEMYLRTPCYPMLEN